MQASKPENLIVRQFVKCVLDFSSQYGREQSGSYTVANVRGCPTNYPKYGDFLESCVLRTYGNWWNDMSYMPDIKPNIAKPCYISKDFIELEFEQKLMIDSVIIYENYNPGAVVGLYAFDYIKNKWTLIWSIFDDLKIKSNSMAFERPLPKKESRKYRPDLTKRDIFSNLVRIEFEHGKLDYYTELDAIEIVGYPFDLKLSKEIAKNIRHIGDEFFSLEISSDHLENASVQIKNESVRSEKNKLTITDLPNELLQNIIRLLDLRDIFFLRSTCRKFYQLCSERDLFNQLDLKPFWNQVNEALLEIFYNLSCEFKALDVSWSKLKSTQIFKRIFENSCSQLTVLNMENCQFLNANILSLISDNCSKLVSLNVASCLNISPNDHNGFAPIANLFNLEVLNLYRTLVDGQQMVKIVQSCKNLKSLNLGACMKINEFDEVMTTLAENCDRIESLDLWRAYSLTSMGLRKLANNCFNLKDLDIGWCRSVISFEWLKIMLEKCVKMRKLFLTSLRVSDNELYLISQKGLQIEQLDILGSRSISKETVELVLKNCKKLKLFDISFCFYEDREQIIEFSQMFPNCSIKTNADSARFIFLAL